ncbi:DnaJ domain-containing protein [Thiomicrorhabdus sp. ZW0627]|uniref:DnaJ domain-containing protein n=1 Tax=Thiomicrorhabdus sp. ZW0627 TaxID=3039774 RepID=UPI0024365CBF|nr:DnaJ domain-containing protein [Thiomicrorhabdus sp. ZW0627]MDG6773109.1 DnaJ domain-containing protein [Thiomicrorhabdus sp. ZW0627]
MASLNRPYNSHVDYFAVLGVHKEACPNTVKQAYRKLARRYHPDVSKMHDAKKKFQEIAEAYEILSKHREAYWRDFEMHNRSQFNRKSSANQKQSRSQTKAKTKQQTNESQSRQYNGYRAHKPIDGKDRLITYPLTLRYAIRLLKLQSFYIPSLKVKMKFTREALMGKTFRLKGKGYGGLFGGKPGDFLVRFEIKNESLEWRLEGADIYGTFNVAEPLLAEGNQIRLEAPSGSFSIEVPSNYSSDTFIRIDNMGLPPGEKERAGHLYARLIAA